METHPPGAGTEAVAVDPRRPAKLPFKTKLFYSTGGMSEVLMGNIIATLAMPIYNVGLGVSAVLVGYAISIPRIWDAFTDPIIANISDNTHSRFGRRRPYIFLGTLFAALFSILVWMPPRDLGEIGLVLYFLAFSILFFTAYTAFTIPYHAMGAELTSDYDERTRLMSYKTFFLQLGATLFIPWAYKLCFVFGENEVEGVKIVGILYGGLMILFVILPVFFCRERFSEANRSKIKVFPAIKYTLKTKPFFIICIGTFITVFGVYLVNPLAFYINLGYVEPGDRETVATLTGVFTTTFGVASLVAIPLINALCIRIGKRQTLQAGVALTATGYLVSWFAFNPEMPYLQVIVALLAGPGMTSLWLVVSSIIADICDYDELETGLRREGMYSGVFSWIMKISVGGVMALTGYIVAWTGFNEEVLIQSEATVLKLRLAFMLAPLIFLTLAFFVFMRYKLTREHLTEIQAQLAAKKANV